MSLIHELPKIIDDGKKEMKKLWKIMPYSKLKNGQKMYSGDIADNE